MKKDELKEEIKEAVKKYSAIEATAKSAGGKIILDSLKKDIVSSVDEVCRGYKTLSHTELIAVIAKLSERLSILRIFNNSAKNKKISSNDLKILTESEE